MIPLKLETLLEGKVVEQNRVEYKEGWNPSPVIHTICAFANDYSNVNGGYIVLGVKAEKGIPVLPPKGLDSSLLDDIQQEIFEYCNQIEPRYIPMIDVVEYPENGANLIYIKCSPGDSGPYQAPRDVYSKKKNVNKADKTLEYWIRPASLTTTAKQDEIAELFDKFNSVPFDDRVNRKANISCIRRSFVEDFLYDSNSSLVNDIDSKSLEDLLVSLEVANETDVELAIRNIGILMFSDRPDKLIPGAEIDLVKFDTLEAEASDSFTEKTFYGPIWKQVKDAMDYLTNNILTNKVVKVDGQMKSRKIANYPYAAIEEALVNAVFHKSYREPEPVEIRVYLDKIQIINYPGPDKWIDMNKFKSGKVRARKYRNRRIGEMFKEIDLSEKQSTGISKILKELELNGSPAPDFETDADRTYLISTLFASSSFVQNDQSGDQKLSDHSNFSQNERSLKEVLKEVLKEAEYQKMLPIIEYISENDSITTKKAEELTGKSNTTAYRYLKTLEACNVIQAEGNTDRSRYTRIIQ